jgi:PAS domain S-box-containing protein
MSDSDKREKDFVEEINLHRGPRKVLERLRSAHKKAQDSIRKNEEFFRSLVETSSDWIWEVDKAGFYTYASPKVEELLGHKPEEVVGKRPFDFMPADEAQKIEKIFLEEITSSKKSFSKLENINLHKDGHAVVLETSGVPFFDTDGELLGYRGIDRDITERKQTEEALVESEEKFRTLAEQSPNMIFINQGGQVVYANKRCEETMGYSREEFYSADFDYMSLIVPEYKEAIRKAFCEHTEGREVTPFEYAVITKDGKRIESFYTTKLIKYKGENAILGTIMDITERRRIEEALRDSEEKFRTLVEDTLQGVIIIQDGRVIFANPSAQRMVDYTFEELSQLSAEEGAKLIHPEDRETLLQHLEKRLRGEGAPETLVYRVIRKGGEVRWVEGTVSVTEYGGKPAMQIYNTDITEGKFAEEQLRQIRMELEHTSRLITAGELTTGLAHELNQPLCAASNYADACSRLLSRKNIDVAKIKELVQEIAKQTNKAGDIIRHIRKLVRKHEPVRTKAHINSIVREVLKLEAAEANQQNVKIKTKLGEGIPEVLVDVIEVEQVLMNLISNAFEAMVETPIEKRELEIQTSLSGDGYILVSVEDTGKSLSEEAKEKLFDSFFTTKPDGLGIGLSLSRSIVESHGGQIYAKPNHEGGAVFQFTLPVKGEGNG